MMPVTKEHEAELKEVNDKVVKAMNGRMPSDIPLTDEYWKVMREYDIVFNRITNP